MGRATSTLLRSLAAAAVLSGGAASAALPLHAARGERVAPELTPGVAAVSPPRPKRGEGPWQGEEDFARAFATARAQRALVLVDVWAPW